MAIESTTPIRVRYAETDAMGIVHHAVYPVWMELGRSDLLRQLGESYAQWEARGIRMSVAGLSVIYRAPARYRRTHIGADPGEIGREAQGRLRL